MNLIIYIFIYSGSYLSTYILFYDSAYIVFIILRVRSYLKVKKKKIRYKDNYLLIIQKSQKMDHSYI